jgi:hypothetical protein
MHATALLKQGHNLLLAELDGLSDAAWEQPAALGYWSIKQIVAHLIIYERIAEEALSSFLEIDAPYLDEILRKMDELPDSFNDTMVAAYDKMNGEQVLAELTAVHLRNLALVAQIPAAVLGESGRLKWYKPYLSTEDFLIYVNYGHKREHAAQIHLFRQQRNASAS